MKLLLILLTMNAAAFGQELTSIRKVYLTGSKASAIKKAPQIMRRFTCLEAVGDPAQADAIVVLSQAGDIELPPTHLTSSTHCLSTWDGGVDCTSTGGGQTSKLVCDPFGAACDSYTYDYQMKDISQDRLRAFLEKFFSRAEVIDKTNKTALWSYDEGKNVRNPNIAAFQNPWWAQLNSAVGCGKVEIAGRKDRRDFVKAIHP